jgi:hypothetical protein
MKTTKLVKIKQSFKICQGRLVKTSENIRMKNVHVQECRYIDQECQKTAKNSKSKTLGSLKKLSK